MTTRIGQLAAGNRKKLKPVLGALCAILFALCSSTEAQQPKKFARIGYLSPSAPASESARSEAIRLALSELGYIEGQNIATEVSLCGGKGGSFSRATGRAGASQRRRHCGVGRSQADPCGQERDQDDTNRYDGRWDRSRRAGLC